MPMEKGGRSGWWLAGAGWWKACLLCRQAGDDGWLVLDNCFCVCVGMAGGWQTWARRMAVVLHWGAGWLLWLGHKLRVHYGRGQLALLGGAGLGHNANMQCSKPVIRQIKAELSSPHLV